MLVILRRVYYDDFLLDVVFIFNGTVLYNTH